MKNIVTELVHESETHIYNKYLVVIDKDGEVKSTSTLRYSESNVEELKKRMDSRHVMLEFEELLGLTTSKKLELNYPKKSTLKRPKNLFITVVNEPNPNTVLIACDLPTLPYDYELPEDASESDLVVVVSAKLRKEKTRKELSDNMVEILEGKDVEGLVKFEIVTKIEKGNMLDISGKMELNEFLSEISEHKFAKDFHETSGTHLNTLATRLARLKSNLTSWQALYDFE